jgi:hypothetical protein
MPIAGAPPLEGNQRMIYCRSHLLKQQGVDSGDDLVAYRFYLPESFGPLDDEILKTKPKYTLPTLFYYRVSRPYHNP